MRNPKSQTFGNLPGRNSTTALQSAAFAVILLVVGVAGGMEHNRMPLLPGAVIMLALIALAGWLVHKSNDREEGVPTTDYLEEDPSDILSGKVAEAYRLLSPAEQAAFMVKLAQLRKKKAASSVPALKAASSPKRATKNHPHCKAQRGACQV